MVSNKKLKLLQSWKDNLFKELSISEVIKISKKKTKTWVFNSLKELVKKNLLIMKTKGNLNLYNLNMDNPILLKFLQYLEIKDLYNFKHLNIIIEIIDKIPQKNYCLILFGSYAENKQTSSSDLDISFLIENKNLEKKFKPYLNEVKLNYATKIDEHYIVFEDFIKMLLKKEENLGKQIFRKHKIFFNPDIYYELIKKAYKNGFR